MVYIPFASLLGLQAALKSLVSNEPVHAPTPIHFIDPRLGGGSLLDHDSGGLGEPLNVSLLPARLADCHAIAHDELALWGTGHHFGAQLAMDYLGWWLFALRECYRLVSPWSAHLRL